MTRTVQQEPRPRWLYVWLLPLLWSAVSFGSSRYPGDEYGMFAFGSLPAAWVVLLLGESGSFTALATRILVAGVVTYALAGLLLDALRAPRWFWLVAWLGIAAVLTVTSVNRYPTLQRAISKNGSLWAYVFFGANLGLAAATLLGIPAGIVGRLLHRRPRPCDCRACGYDLTGNVSGRCPECGTPIGQSP